jgi:electron transfer flavoprotein beta subunit
MQIIVCVKQVASPESRFKIDPITNLIDETGCEYVLNPNDEFAVEEALRVRDGQDGSRVTVLTLGPPRAKDVLVRCLAMGADDARLLWDGTFEQPDVHATSLILAKAINLLGYDLIFCGCEAWDDGQGYVGAGIAEELGIPLITGVNRVELATDGKRATVLRGLERGDQVKIECSLPAVFCVAMGANRPRYPSLRNRLQAQKREIAIWDLKAIGLGEAEVSCLMRLESVSYPRPRTKRVTTPDPSLPVMERLKFFLASGVSERQSNLLDGSTDDAISKVTQYLIEEGIIQREV